MENKCAFHDTGRRWLLNNLWSQTSILIFSCDLIMSLFYNEMVWKLCEVLQKERRWLQLSVLEWESYDKTCWKLVFLLSPLYAFIIMFYQYGITLIYQLLLRLDRINGKAWISFGKQIKGRFIPFFIYTFLLRRHCLLFSRFSFGVWMLYLFLIRLFIFSSQKFLSIQVPLGKGSHALKSNWNMFESPWEPIFIWVFKFLTFFLHLYQFRLQSSSQSFSVENFRSFSILIHANCFLVWLGWKMHSAVGIRYQADGDHPMPWFHGNITRERTEKWVHLRLNCLLLCFSIQFLTFRIVMA